MIKTRFAPSPTGFMHLGNARTALFNYLFAAANNGVFLLRIEDTDAERSKEEFLQQLLQDLIWLGCDWQEGPNKDQGKGPYKQSARDAIYANYYQQLQQKGLAYPCFCSPEKLAIIRKSQLSSGQPPRYPGTCSHLKPEEVAEKISQGLQPTLRFKVEADVEFVDLIKGRQFFAAKDLGDFIIRRADGSPSFMFSNAIDDALMQVTHALRGEDHLTNTPRQLLILQALNLPQPTYGHITLITGSDGAPLSKRHGSKSVLELQQMGYLPLAIINFLARLGHYYTDNELMSAKELAANFKIENLGSSSARFDEVQLHHWQKRAVMQSGDAALWQWLLPQTQQQIAAEHENDFINLVRNNAVFPQDAENLAQQLWGDSLHYSAEAAEIMAAAGAEFYKLAITAVDANFDYKNLLEELKAKANVKGKNLFQPLRLALTGELHGPEMDVIFKLMGPQQVIKRFKQAQQKFATPKASA